MCVHTKFLRFLSATMWTCALRFEKTSMHVSSVVCFETQFYRVRCTCFSFSYRSGPCIIFFALTQCLQRVRHASLSVFHPLAVDLFIFLLHSVYWRFAVVFARHKLRLCFIFFVCVRVSLYLIHRLSAHVFTNQNRSLFLLFARNNNTI